MALSPGQFQHRFHTQIHTTWTLRQSPHQHRLHAELFGGFKIGQRIFDHDAPRRVQPHPAEQAPKSMSIGFRPVVGMFDREYFFEQVGDAEQFQHPVDVMGRHIACIPVCGPLCNAARKPRWRNTI